MPGSLDGIRVLDLTSVFLGPLATQILGDHGADVIKVEPPDGDVTRHVTPMRSPGMGAVFLNANRNKRSVVLDLKQPAAREAFLALAARADVLVASVRPQAMRRLGLDSATLRSANPGLIHVTACGYSERGPYSGRPAYDDIIQAASGFAALQAAHSGEPRYASSVIADKTVALTVVYAVAMALFARERSRGTAGQAVEVPMFETMAAFLLPEHMAGKSFEPPEGPSGYTRALAPHRRPYRTADGWISVLPYSGEQWQRFFRVAGRPEMAADRRVTDGPERSRKVGELYAMVAEATPARSTAEWLRLLDEADVPAMPVKDVDDVLADPHMAELDFFPLFHHPSEGTMRAIGIPVTFSGTPGRLARPAPQLGEHSREVLREAGLGEAAIAAMVASGATAEPAPAG